jgi:hypothetical protein
MFDSGTSVVIWAAIVTGLLSFFNGYVEIDAARTLAVLVDQRSPQLSSTVMYQPCLVAGPATNTAIPCW